jgi:alkaline phosphatase D
MNIVHQITNKLYFLFLLTFINLTTSSRIFADDAQSLTIGFGSCAEQTREQPIWDTIASHNPELFILMGDNVYIDSDDPLKMKADYHKLSQEPHFSKFIKSTPLVAIWDDHDYAMQDGGKNFIGKNHAKKAFLNFFNYPELEPLREKPGGIFHSKWLEFKRKKIQIILLDTRWYRDTLVDSYLTETQRQALNLGPYQPTLNKNTTLLGSEQWSWLENELKKPADLRLLVSSIQVLTEFSGYETWANFPHEREKLLNMLHQTNKDNTLILSGDIHRAEMAKVKYKDQSLLEITSSGLAVKTYPAAVNIHRIGQAFEKKNYGILSINEDDSKKLSVVATIYDDNGSQQLTAKLGE